MSQVKFTLQKNNAWDQNRRYKINDVVIYSGANYQNETGLNSTPGVGTDWKLLPNVTDANLTKINAIDQAVSTAEKATWNGKQDALVSGTNIKTINGNTLLGTTDLVIPTAGELSGKEFQMTTGAPSNLTQIGAGIAVMTGTGDAVAAAFTNTFNSASRRRVVSAATAGSSVIIGDGSFRKVVLGADFTSYFIFGNEDAATVADARFFVGFSNSAGFGNVDPSTKGTLIGIGSDSGDTQVSLIHNYSVGLATKIPLGVNFPANTSAVDLYLAKFQFLTSGGVTITVTNLSNGTSVANTITTNIPPIGTSYFAFMQRNNGSTALAVRMSLIQWSLIRNSY